MSRGIFLPFAKFAHLPKVDPDTQIIINVPSGGAPELLDANGVFLAKVVVFPQSSGVGGEIGLVRDWIAWSEVVQGYMLQAMDELLIIEVSNEIRLEIMNAGLISIIVRLIAVDTQRAVASAVESIDCPEGRG